MWIEDCHRCNEVGTKDRILKNPREREILSSFVRYQWEKEESFEHMFDIYINTIDITYILSAFFFFFFSSLFDWLFSTMNFLFITWRSSVWFNLSIYSLLQTLILTFPLSPVDKTYLYNPIKHQWCLYGERER